MARKPKGEPTGDDSQGESAWQQDSVREVLGFQLARATVSAHRAYFASVGTPLQLRPVEFTLLCLIEESPGVSARQLARTLAVTPPNMTHWLDRLAARGWVRRQQNPDDGRTMDLHLTEEGALTARRALQVVREREAAEFGDLSVGERTMLMELLAKVARSAGITNR